MKNILKKMYVKFAMIPITLLVFSGIYEMFIGDMMRGIMNRNVIWVIPVTKTMIIDTIITLTVVFFLVNGFPKRYKKLSENSKTKALSSIILVMCVIIAIALFAYGKIYFTQVLFRVNYPIYMGVLVVLCILQKVLDDIIYPNKNKVDDIDHSKRIDDSISEEAESSKKVLNADKR